MIFYPGETDDELRERLAFFSLVTPAACDFLLEAAGELGDAESVKKACDIAIALLDPAHVIRSCGSDCLDYFHALALCPSINDAELAAELRLLERQPAWAKWCTQFWVYHARGDEVSAAYAYEKWLECPRKPDHSSRLFAYELMMLCAMGAYEEAFAYAGCDGAFPTLENLVHAFNCYDHELGMVYSALIEGYARTGQFDAALNWVLYSLAGRRRDGVFHQYGVIRRILPLLPKEFQVYIRAAALALDRAGLVAHDQLSIVREIHGGVDTALPPLASDVQLSDFSHIIVDALRFLTNTNAREAHFTSPDQFPCLPVADFLLAQVAAVRVKETTGTLRHAWLTKACEFSDGTPEFAWALAHLSWDKASDDERETLLEYLPGAFADLAMIDVGVYEQVKQWITQQGEQAVKLNPDRATAIRAQILFQLGRHATYCSRWLEALDYLNQSIAAHQNPTWMPKLQQLLSRNPRADQTEPTLADSRAQHEAAQLWEQIYSSRKPELGDAFRRWIALCRTYSGFTPRVLQVTYLVEYFWLYIWTLCEDPNATATDFQQALDDYESIMIAHYHHGVVVGDDATVVMYEEESISQRMAFARTMFAHRLSDHELVSQQRRIWRAEESYDERFLGEHELVYLLDSCTQTGDYAGVVAEVLRSEDEQDLPDWLKASLLEACLLGGDKQRASLWASEVKGFSLPQHCAQSDSTYFKSLAIAGECGILRYLVRLVERGEGGYRRDLRKQVLGVVSVWDKVVYPREMGKLAGVLAAAIWVGFDSDGEFPATLSVAGCEWVDAPDLVNPTAADAMTWCQHIAHAIGRLFENDQPPHWDGTAIYASDLEAVREFFVEYFDAKTVGRYRNPATGISADHAVFEDTCDSIAYHCGLCIEIIQTPEGQRPTNGVTIPLENSNNVDKIAQKLRKDGYPILTEPHETSDGKYESTVLGVEDIPITLSAGLR